MTAFEQNTSVIFVENDQMTVPQAVLIVEETNKQIQSEKIKISIWLFVLSSPLKQFIKHSMSTLGSLTGVAMQITKLYIVKWWKYSLKVNYIKNMEYTENLLKSLKFHGGCMYGQVDLCPAGWHGGRYFYQVMINMKNRSNRSSLLYYT